MGKVANYILGLSSVIIIFLLSEVGFRIVAYRNDLKTLKNIEKISKIPQPGKMVSLGQIIQLSRNPKIIYELIPNVSVILNYKLLKRKEPVTTNSDGFRGKAIPIDKSPQSRRIVGIGDSLMFGWGVRNEETYLSILSELLNSNNPGISWEIINMAVPGYNTVMEVETLKEKGLQYKPDLVIIHYFWNDLRLPNFIREQEDYFALNQSFIIKYFRRNLNRIKMIKAPRHSSGINFEDDPQKVPKQYRDLVGIKAYYRAMEELQSLSIKHKFDVVVLSYRPKTRIKKMCRLLGFQMVEIAPLWQVFASEEGIQDADRTWRLSENDTHPSVIAHKFIANTLSKILLQLSWSDRKS